MAWCWTELDFFDCLFHGVNDGNFEGILFGESLVSTDNKVIGYDEGIKMIYTGGKVLVNIPGYVYGIKLGIDIGTQLGSLDGLFYGSNDGNLEGILYGYPPGILWVKCLYLMKTSNWMI